MKEPINNPTQLLVKTKVFFEHFFFPAVSSKARFSSAVSSQIPLNHKSAQTTAVGDRVKHKETLDRNISYILYISSKVKKH